MHKFDGLSKEELIGKGYIVQPDGRLRFRISWKSKCTRCKKWFGRLKGDECWNCYDASRNEHVWAVVRNDKATEAAEKRKKAERRRKGTK